MFEYTGMMECWMYEENSKRQSAVNSVPLTVPLPDETGIMEEWNAGINQATKSHKVLYKDFQ